MHPKPERRALSANQQHVTRWFPKALGGSMKRATFLAVALCLAFITTTASAQTTYTWNQTGSRQPRTTC